jgi:hypothetical protein
MNYLESSGKTEWNLSDKITRTNELRVGEILVKNNSLLGYSCIPTNDVREFIKRLKETMEEYSHEPIQNREVKDVYQIIDDLAGEKLC